MAFTSVILSEIHVAGKRVVWGSWTTDTTTGNITTGLNTVEHIQLTPNKSAVTANQSAVNETFPLNNVNGAVTIFVDSGVDGYWEAIGI